MEVGWRGRGTYLDKMIEILAFFLDFGIAVATQLNLVYYTPHFLDPEWRKLGFSSSELVSYFTPLAKVLLRVQHPHRALKLKCHWGVTGVLCESGKWV